MSSIPPIDPLSRDLAAWRIQPSRDPQFRASVWSRIRAADRPSAWRDFARAHAAVVSVLLVGAVLAGAWGGKSEAKHRREADRTTIAAAYVRSLDARWMRHP